MMKRILSFLLLPFAVYLSAADEIPFLSQKVEIDGKPGDPGWKNALRVEKFNLSRGDTRWKTTGLIGRTKTHICVAIFADYDDPSKVNNSFSGHDHEIYLDDAIEAFIDSEGTGLNYYHVIANLKGAVYDVHRTTTGQDYSWTSGAKAKGSFPNPKQIYWEMTIPICGLNPAKNKNGEIALAICRCIPHLTSDQISGGRFHEPATWPRFKLTGDYPLEQVATKTSRFFGNQKLNVHVKNVANQSRVFYSFFNGKKTENFTLPAGKEKDLEFDVYQKFGEESEYTLILKNEKGNEVFRHVYLFVPAFDQLFGIKTVSDIIYANEPLLLQIEIRETPEAPFKISIEDKAGKTLAEHTLKLKKMKSVVPIAIPAGGALLKCTYKETSTSRYVQAVPSPWE
ncbi:MAG: hypothetical protein IKB16_10385 [Lentisphaeria bacterium]|nr:hypothetical protein [Lentisphaeria bacterium]